MSKLALAGIGLLTLAAVLAVFSFYGLVAIPPAVLVTSRWLAIAALVVYAIQRRSLTTWILVSMVIGAEIGHEFPGIAVNLRILSQVFLRLIRTIIAPLLFGTLVVGIAGHSDIKQVGRMGVKAILYFEVVTTIALFVRQRVLRHSAGALRAWPSGTSPPSSTSLRSLLSSGGALPLLNVALLGCCIAEALERSSLE